MKENKKRFTILNVFEMKNLSEVETILRKLNLGTDIDTIDSDGRTLLMEATVYRDHKLMSLLIKRGANVNSREKRNWTALHFAAQNNDMGAASLLIENGADVNAQDDYGNNVILKATSVSVGNGEVIRRLLKQGADCRVKNKSGVSALDLAGMVTNFDLMQFFKDGD